MSVYTSGLEDKVYTGDFTSLPDIESLDSALAHAYEKMWRLLYHVITLRKRRNRLPAVSELPAEILLRIFRLCTSQGGNNHEGWFAFSQVCAPWRRVALGDPSLWCHIDLETPDLVSLMLERSLSRPLYIVASSYEQLSLSCVPGRDHTRSFALTQLEYSDYLKEDVDNYLSGQFPLLDTLSFVGTDTFAWPVLAFDLATLDAPQLQALSITNWPLLDLNLPGWEISLHFR